MKRRIRIGGATVMVAVGALAVFSSTAVAAPALSKDPKSADFGQATSDFMRRTVTITNNTSTTLDPGTWEISGDVPQPLYLASPSTCADPLGIGPNPTIEFAPGASCTFDIGYNGTGVAPGRYRAKLNATFGDKKISFSATVEKP